MSSIRNTLRRFSALSYCSLAVFLLMACFAAVPAAEASLIGLQTDSPNIYVPDITITKKGGPLDTDPTAFFSAAATGLFTFTNSPDPDTWTNFNGAYSLSYNVPGQPNRLSISEPTGNALLLGDIIKAGDANDGKTNDFLIKITSLDQSFKNAGFGDMAGVLFSQAGAVKQSNNFSTPVPIPGSALLFAPALLGIFAARRRKEL